MEADWEFEIGREAPVIEAHWTGFVDLRSAPNRVTEISETQSQPALAETLVRLNSSNSSVWTSKCDVFELDRIHPDELQAQGDEVDHALACYIDLLMRSDQVWKHPGNAERDCKRLCARMRTIPLRCCRVDLVVRNAAFAEGNSLGVTAYFAACGRTEQNARARLAECMAVFVETVAFPLEANQMDGGGFRK